MVHGEAEDVRTTKVGCLTKTSDSALYLYVTTEKSISNRKQLQNKYTRLRVWGCKKCCCKTFLVIKRTSKFHYVSRQVKGLQNFVVSKKVVEQIV